MADSTGKRFSAFTVEDLGEDGGPLTSKQVQDIRLEYGLNTIVTQKRVEWYTILLQAFLHPFNILLCVIAISSAIAEEFSTTVIISVMVIISTSLRFYQEWKSEGAVHGLLKLITKSVFVVRFDALEPTLRETMVPAEELVPGDWIVLRPGEIVPADGVILTSKVFFVSQAPLTGEALPVEKYKLPDVTQETEDQKQTRRQSDVERARRVSVHKPMSKITQFFRQIFGLKVSTDAHLDQNGYQMKEDLSCLDNVFMGSQVITGMATVRVLRTGPDTLFGKMAEALSKSSPINPFQRGVKKISWMFFITMAFMVPIVFVLQGLIQKDWKQAFIFSLSVAVGLTPEMLPMIVNACLAKGSVEMTKKDSIIKKLDAIINLGAVNILCTDKTGTLTKSVVQLTTHINPYGNVSFMPLQIGFLNSYFQSILQNPLDTAITVFYDKVGKPKSREAGGSDEGISDESKSNHSLMYDKAQLVRTFSRIDELPFDFTRRRLSVVLQQTTEENTGRFYLVCKGAVEETLAVCTMTVIENVRNNGANVFPDDSDLIPLTPGLVGNVMSQYEQYTDKGFRVLAVAYKALPLVTSPATETEECQLVFVGFLTFFDPPKETTKDAIVQLIKHNVEVKVLTGDAANICSTVCKDINLPVKAIVTSEDLVRAVEAGTVSEVVEMGTIFAKLTPLQKSMVVQTLKARHHVVGFMGDGINDAPALKEADVGISVENGVDICRESADVILLDKDLNVVVDGIRIGRKTYGNTIKYIAMAVSSNFGNVFSVLVAAAWLPFEPMQSLHLLTQNLLYDCSQIVIPWDSVDDDFLLKPHTWKMKSILVFMVWMGPWSSVFDILTFAYMYFVFDIKDRNDRDKVKLFQTTWFTVGLLTQTLIVHMIRTTKIPLIQSRASWMVTTLTVIVMGTGLALPYIPYVYENLEFTNGLPAEVYYFLGVVLVSYCVVANLAKFLYILIFKEWF